MATTTRTPRAVKLGANVVTADDINLGAITRVGKLYAYTAAGRVPIESYMDTWAVV